MPCWAQHQWMLYTHSLHQSEHLCSTVQVQPPHTLHCAPSVRSQPLHHTGVPRSCFTTSTCSSRLTLSSPSLERGQAAKARGRRGSMETGCSCSQSSGQAGTGDYNLTSFRLHAACRPAVGKPHFKTFYTLCILQSYVRFIFVTIRI